MQVRFRSQKYQIVFVAGRNEAFAKKLSEQTAGNSVIAFWEITEYFYDRNLQRDKFHFLTLFNLFFFTNYVSVPAVLLLSKVI